jgi:hypothetical protein
LCFFKNEGNWICGRVGDKKADFFFQTKGIFVGRSIDTVKKNLESRAINGPF